MAKKVLFINQEISPYVPESELSIMGRDLPNKMQEAGYEIRTFMPKWGNINERRGQLRRHRPSVDHQGRIHTSDSSPGLFHRQRRLFHEASHGRG